jgi:hypothetical protein
MILNEKSTLSLSADRRREYCYMAAAARAAGGAEPSSDPYGSPPASR